MDVQKGWRDDESFVCIIVRDNEYHLKHPLHGAGNNNSTKTRSYHSYRNSDIDSYIPAMEWLANNGVWVLRMGRIAKPVSSKHPKIIDYPFLNDKSDLQDIWLFANCMFTISVGTGIDNVSHVYGKPILFLNSLPMIDVLTYHKSSFVPKHLYFKKNKSELTLSEHLRHSYRSHEGYIKADIVIINLSEEEILEYVKEFWYRLHESGMILKKILPIKNTL